MAGALTLPLVRRWIYATLSADGTVNAVFGSRIHRDRVPQGGALPAIVVQLRGSDIATAIDSGRPVIWEQLHLSVQALYPGGSGDAIEAAWRRALTLLDNGTGSPTGGQVYQARQTGSFSYSDDDEGIDTQHLGVFLDVWAKDA